MLIFHFKPENMLELNTEDSRKKLMDSLKKFQEADEELERICKELGIDKPEMVCRSMNLE
jgi:translation initiation factor 2 alpha subunit (eIF-2alpha)